MREHCEFWMVGMVPMSAPMVMAAMLFLDFNQLSAFSRAGVGFG